MTQTAAQRARRAPSTPHLGQGRFVTSPLATPLIVVEEVATATLSGPFAMTTAW